MNWLEPAWQFFKAGGPLMPPLVLVSLWLWAAILAKLHWLWQVRAEKLDDGRALEWLQCGRPRARGRLQLKGAALAGFLARRSGQPELDLRLWRAAVLAVQGELNRHLVVIVALAAAAPLLGLLGTVNGMIGTFEAIQRFGTGNARALAAGISEALITTQAGLMVAIPGLMAGYYLRRQVRKERQKLAEFQRMVERRLRSEGEKPCCA